MNTIFLTIFLLIVVFATATLAKDSSEENSNIKEFAIFDAKHTSSDIHKAYLYCYPLNRKEKKECHKKLEINVLSQSKSIGYMIRTFGKQSIDSYLRFYAYESEKLGFSNLLERSGKVCKYIMGSPVYNKITNSYTVKCKSSNHKVQFNTNSKRWNLIL